jgi:type IV pilus assembly protein PilM
MAKTQSAWGIEIGAFAIKGIRLERVGDEVTVEDFAYIPHAKPLTTPDVDVNEMTRLTLQQFVTAKNLEGVKVVVSVPGHAGLARFAKLPPVEPKKIPDIVKFEAVQQIPFPIDEVEWDYQTFSSPDNPEVEVGIFAITKEKIAERLSLYAEFGIQPEIVTLGPLAVFNAMTYDLALADDHAPVVTLDIGTQSSDVIVAESGRCWIRTFPLGGTHFTESLLETFKINYGKADRLKAESASSKYARQMMQAMRPVFGDLVTDVQRSIGHYQMSHREKPIEHVYGVGSTFRIPGLRKFLGQQLNIEVQRVDEFKRISVEGRDAADFMANAVNFVTAYGLALQGVGLSRISVNLSPLGNLREKLWQAKNKWFIAAACVAVVGSAALFMRPLFESQKLEGSEATLAAAKNAINQGEGLKRQLDAAKNAGQAGALAANVQHLLADREIWPHLARDAFSATLSSGPDAELKATDAEALVKIPAKDRKLISIRDLSGNYAFNAESKKRTITVTMKVEFVNMDDKAGTYLDSSVGAWLRNNLDRKDVPYVIEKESIKTTASAQPIMVIASEAKDTKPADGAPAGGDTGGMPTGGDTGAASGAPSGGAPSGGAPSGGAPSGGEGRSGRRGRGGGGEVKAGGGMSGKGGASLGGPPPAEGTVTEDPAAAAEAPGADAGASTDAAQKGSANLEALAPILDPNPLYPPGTKIFSGDVQFTVVIRETGPKPAEAGATP